MLGLGRVQELPELIGSQRKYYFYIPNIQVFVAADFYLQKIEIPTLFTISVGF
jgi:hypothetical protein